MQRGEEEYKKEEKGYSPGCLRKWTEVWKYCWFPYLHPGMEHSKDMEATQTKETVLEPIRIDVKKQEKSSDW